MKSRATITDFRDDTALVGALRLHYWVGGDPDGVPVLLWHGFLGTAYCWHKVAPALAQQGLAVLIPDMRGFGDSDKPSGEIGYDNRSLAQECRALVRDLGFGKGRPLIIAGHDMGAPPALLWASDHPAEVAALVYIDAPVMLAEILQPMLAYNEQSMSNGSLWWWTLPLAPGVPERLIVGNERAFLTWFFDGATADPRSISSETIDEYLRTFSGREGVLGAMGVYRAAFVSMKQTAPLALSKVSVPCIALGGARNGLGRKVGEMLESVASQVESQTLDDSGHFVPEERPEAVIRAVLGLAAANFPNR